MNSEKNRYSSRIDKLSNIILSSTADIICLQEVRFDLVQRLPKEGPNQIHHLMKRLPGFQYVFQPAMSYPENVLGRIEEGFLILLLFYHQR